MVDLKSIRAEFIEKTGLIAQGEGMPRIAGRVFGLLMFDGVPVSFGELSEQLQVSRGSISSSVRMLEDKGAIKRVGLAGSRQDHFQLADKPFEGILEGALKRVDRAAEEIEGSINKLPDDASDIRDRLRDYGDFYNTLGLALRHAMAKDN